MKLIRLKLLSSFRSLPKDFELHFRKQKMLNFDSLNQFHPYCFAGLNGSGKSNVLEALSLIFFYLECSFAKYLPDDFESVFNKSPLTFSFELEYLHFETKDKSNHIFIKFQNNQLEFYRVIGNEQYPVTTSPKRKGEFKEDAPAKRYLPELVVGYSSGENEILSLPFLKTRLMHFDYYKQTLLEGEEYYNKTLTSLVYIDYNMSQAVLLANFLMQNSNENDPDNDILKPIKNILKIEKLHSFRLYIKDFTIKDEGVVNAKIKERKLFSEISGKNSIIDKLKKCSTSSFQPDKDTLILDYYVNEVTIKAFKHHFHTPFELFQAFQTLIELNAHFMRSQDKREIYMKESMYILEKMPKAKAEEQAFYFNNFLIKKEDVEKPLLVKSLSDGEHQFLHSMGICLMLKDKSALLLLDEPETHFNPDWRSQFISLLNDCLQKGEGENWARDILITSHSPFIISDCFPDKVVVFEKGRQPINARDMKFNTFGTSVNIVIEEIFKKEESIPDYSLFRLKQIENREFKTLEDIQKAKEDSRELGESPEKVFLFRKLILEEERLKNNA